MTVLYVASAAFTPAFQAMIPDLLPDEAEYTKALSLSRLAADLESVASPVLAAPVSSTRAAASAAATRSRNRAAISSAFSYTSAAQKEEEGLGM